MWQMELLVNFLWFCIKMYIYHKLVKYSELLKAFYWVFNWLLNSLNLILMLLDDLHKQTRPTAGQLAISISF